MSRTFKIAVVLLLLALAPVRALAITTVGLCATGEERMAAVHAGHGEAHEHGQAPAGSHERCETCLEHCASAALVSLPELVLPAGLGDKRIGFAERSRAAFFPDPLDPPPLAG